jgi:hypothetical protein
MKYRIYIDEVGNPDVESSDNPNHRFLSLTGVILELGYVKSVIYPQMESLKAKYFEYHPDDPIVLHRKEIINAKPPFQSLRDSQRRKFFDSDLLQYLSSWQYVVITVCLDKKRHKETYSTWRYDPYHYCLAMILERYILFLERHAVKGDAMAESRGGKEDMRLKDSFHRLWNQGTPYIDSDRFHKALTSCQLKIKVKANNISGLQLADLVAHPSRNEILIEQKMMEKKLAPFALHITNILAKKYDQDDNSVYGKKFI